MILFLLILFFVSLAGIIFIIGRKLMLLEYTPGITITEEVLFEIPYIGDVKHFTIKNFKKHGYISLVATIRMYVRGTNFLKNQYTELKDRVKNMQIKNSNEDSSEKKEISKFLKIISDYKHKIREIKHKIKEEEKSL